MITRRSFLYGSGGAALTMVLACKRRPADGTLSSPVSPSHVQVVPHQDDDLLFMNPDVQIAIRSSSAVATIYLTDGEGDDDSLAAITAYAAERQRGVRAAYALMAGVPDKWTGTSLSLDPIHRVELFTLDAKPQIQLAFVDLPEDDDHLATGGKHSLRRLEDNAAIAVDTILPDRAVVAQSSKYSDASIVSVLVRLFERFKPTVVRALDQAPDNRYVNDPRWALFHDHPDHVESARIVDRAVREYWFEHGAELTVVNYRCYNLADVRSNLGAEQIEAKSKVFAKYLEHDPKSSFVSPYVEYAASQYYRWPRGGAWIARTPTGLSAFAVKSGAVVEWIQRGTAWDGPFPIGNATNLAPYVATAVDDKGLIHLAVREADGDHAILTIAQNKRGQWPPQMTRFGSPNAVDDDHSQMQVGLPVPALVGNAFVVFAKNAGGGLSSKIASQLLWNDLGGFEVQDVTSTKTSDHRLWVFASTRFKGLRWTQAQPGGPLVLDQTLPIEQPISALVPAAVGNDVALAYRTTNGEIAVLPSMTAQPIVLPGRCGPGQPAIAVADGRIAVFARDDAAGVNVALQTSATSFGSWTQLGGELVDYPIASTSASGALVVIGVNPTGKLVVNEQSGEAFGGWQQYGR